MDSTFGLHRFDRHATTDDLCRPSNMKRVWLEARKTRRVFADAPIAARAQAAAGALAFTRRSLPRITVSVDVRSRPVHPLLVEALPSVETGAMHRPAPPSAPWSITSLDQRAALHSMVASRR